MVAAPCWRRSSTYGATSANTIARTPRPKSTEVSDDSPVVACARGARASSSSARASASEMAADATSRRANAASGVRSIGRGTIAATATTAAANGVAFLASDQRIAPRASVIMRQRKISPTIAKRTDRPSQLTSSSWRVGSTYATARLAKRVPMRIAPPRRSVAVSRSAATMMHETPVTAATPPTKRHGGAPSRERLHHREQARERDRLGKDARDDEEAERKRARPRHGAPPARGLRSSRRSRRDGSQAPQGYPPPRRPSPGGARAGERSPLAPDRLRVAA